MRRSLLALTLLFAGCSPPPPYVVAVVEAGSLIFHVRERGMFVDRIFGWDDDRVNVQQLAIFVGKRAVWRLVYEGDSGRCSDPTTFPVRLGERRCDFRVEGNAHAIVPDRIYDVQLDDYLCGAGICREQWWSGSPVGRFRLDRHGHVVNLRPD